MHFRTTGVPCTGAFRAGAFCRGTPVADATVGARSARRRATRRVRSANIAGVTESEGPVVCWTPEEAWTMAGLAFRLLRAYADGVEHAASEDGAFRIASRVPPAGG